MLNNMEMVASGISQPSKQQQEYHSFHMHLQVILWKELTTDSHYGAGSYVSYNPIMTDLEPAPESTYILKFV